LWCLALLTGLLSPRPLPAQAQGELPTAPPPPPDVGPTLPLQPLPPLPAGGNGGDPRLEAALRQRLFAGPFPAAAPQPANPNGTEWEQARSQQHRPPCSEVGPMRYLHHQADLNGDGTPELLVAVVGSYACGADGCTLMIFRGTATGLEPVAENGLFQSPLRLGNQRHHGWLDLLMPGVHDGVSGGLVQQHFNGSTYGPAAPDPGLPAELPQGAPLLEIPALPFEQLGSPLPCSASSGPG
jgi:hypothetical protein